MSMRHLLILLLVAWWSADLLGVERSGPRLLYDFEDGAEIEELRARADSVSLDQVQDNGVTHGRTCCRMVFKQGGGYGVIQLGAHRITDWSGYGAIAFDVVQERDEKWTVNVELWDHASHNYATRCTSSSIVRPGKNTVVVAIDHAKRNGKEGRDWSELEPQDKINLNDLATVKIFLSCPTTGGDLVWWVDNVRLLTTDALSGPPLAISLPLRAKAFLFGRSSAEVAGFTPIPASSTFPGTVGCGVASGHPQVIGKGWPDALTGSGLLDPSGAPVTVSVSLPDGDYRVWLAGGMAIEPDAERPTYQLRVGETVLVDDHPTPAQVASDAYLFRFLPPLYSERDNALWLDYIERMYPTWDMPVTVRGGTLSITAARFWISSLIVMPAQDATAFANLTAQIRTARMHAFARTLSLDPQHKPHRRPTDPDALAFIPDAATTMHPDTAPNDAERARRSYDLAGAPGQRIVLRLGLTAFAAAGECRVALSSLTGPATIAASAARIYLMDYRVRGDTVMEAALKPLDRVTAETGITWCFYAWFTIPDGTPPGVYSGRMTLTPGAGVTQDFAISLTVYPFHLRADPPYAFGMYYEIPVDAATHQQQLRFMREIGFTATAVPAGQVVGINGETVTVRFQDDAYQRVKEAGFGRESHQLQMSSSLGVARRIASAYLGLGARVNQQPGCEMEDHRLKPLYEDYLRQYTALIRRFGMPVGIEIVDEPREVPNPWNRSLAHTNTYADWMHEAGVTTGFVTAMGDTGDGKDYTTLVDHAGILSTHAGAGSERIMRKTIAAGKPLWIYNTGMDRLSWGFYLGKVGAVGRWEWHFCFADPGSTQGYPNLSEWYNPFTACDGYSPHAPASYAGSMLFKSVYFDVAEGILDATYLTTLTDALAKAGADAQRADAVAAAKALLAELDQTIPFLPDVHGLASGALIGQGLQTPASAHCDEWRRRAAQAIIALTR
jgi:hypothetical protein